MTFNHTTLAWLLGFVLVLSGCTSNRSLAGTKITGQVRVGELATIYEKNGRISKINVSGVSDDAITGYYNGGEKVTFGIADIDYIRVERTDLVKSAFAGAGILVGAVAAALLGLMVLFVAAGA